MTIRTLTLAAALLPLAACGQNAQNGQTPQNAQTEAAPMSEASLSPASRAKVERVRMQARDASLRALSPDHRRAVAGAVNDFNAGTLSFPEAANKIDAILTPRETSAVLSEQRKMRSRMRAAFAGSGAAPRSNRRFGAGRRAPDAGRFLVQVMASPERVRAAMRPPGAPSASP